jgi:hypothetical protein
MSWFVYENVVLQKPPHEDLRIEKMYVEHPSAEGYTESIGDPLGQKNDFRKGFEDGRGVHVREYEDHYLIHWDKIDPNQNPFGHIITDAPHWIVIGLLGIFLLSIMLDDS